MMAIDLELLADINVMPRSLEVQTATSLVEVDGSVFFAAQQSGGPNQLWRIDATDDRAHLVKEFTTVAAQGLQSLVNVGGTLYFVASDGTHGRELWKSDGTTDGTVMVADIQSGSGSSEPSSLTVFNETLYFAAAKLGEGRTLWRSDGTAAGTQQVKNVTVGGGSLTTPITITPAESALYFVSGAKLWRSDGTEVGTVQVKDFGVEAAGPMNLTAVGNTLFFSAQTGGEGRELWKSDGTPGGTTLVKNIAVNAVNSDPSHMVNMGGVLYFRAFSADAGAELWRSDGTAAGTVQVANIGTGSTSGNPGYLHNHNGTLYFTARDQNGYEVWKSDGTTTGTMLVKDIGLSGMDGLKFVTASTGNDPFFTSLGDALYFRAQTLSEGAQLWKTDGTAEGTVLVHVIGSAANPAFPSLVGAAPFDANFTAAGDKLVFVANPSATASHQVWQSDGTAAGTTRVAMQPPFTDHGVGDDPSFVDVGGTILFAANDGANGLELWTTDGTAAGTSLLKDLVPGAASSNPRFFTQVGGATFFVAATEAEASALWITDGTVDGTIPLGGVPGNVRDLRVVNGLLYFTASAAPNRRSLWRSDGTQAGTISLVLVADDVDDLPIVEFNGSVYFRGFGRELWKTDGTPEGTTLVQDIVPGPDGSNVANFVNLGGTLLFNVSDALAPNQVWRTDGSPGGAVRAFEKLASLADHAVLNGPTGSFALIAAASENGTELWRTDGTEAGTSLVKDIRSGPNSSAPGQFAVLDGVAYFVARDDAHGAEIWRSDGTEAGTWLYIDLNPGSEFDGPAEPTPTNLQRLGNVIMFDGSSGAAQRELWMIDGSPTGPTRLVSLEDVPSSAGLSHAVINGQIYVAATVEPYGREIWIGSAVVTPELTGDFDRDGVVNGNDFLRWQRELGSVAPIRGAGADGDGTGLVDGGDLAAWSSQYDVGGEELAPVLAAGEELPTAIAAATAVDMTSTPTVSEHSSRVTTRSELPPLWWTGDMFGGMRRKLPDADSPSSQATAGDAPAPIGRDANPDVRDACFAAWTPLRPIATIDGVSADDEGVIVELGGDASGL
jgi:ELWxxDGT repeat protein